MVTNPLRNSSYFTFERFVPGTGNTGLFASTLHRLTLRNLRSCLAILSAFSSSV